MCDVTPRQMLQLAGDRFPAAFRSGAGTLSLRSRRVQGGLGAGWPHPLACARMSPRRHGASRRHLGGDRRNGSGPHRPSLRLLVQHTLFDPARAPAGKHTAWAYCHVPNGRAVDMTDAIEAQVERFALASGAHSGAARFWPRRPWRATIPTWWGAISTAGRWICGSFSCGRHGGSIARRCRACTSAVRRRRPAAGSTACAVFTRPQRFIEAVR